jgi:hypothetical protein
VSETPVARLVLNRHPGAILVGYEAAARLAPTAELEMSADYVSRHTYFAEPGFVPTPDDARWSFGVAAKLGLSWSFLQRFRLMGRGGLEVMLNRYAYTTAPQTVITPASLRPRVELGLSVDLW